MSTSFYNDFGMPFRITFFQLLRKSGPKMISQLYAETFWLAEALPERLRGASSISHRFWVPFWYLWCRFRQPFRCVGAGPTFKPRKPIRRFLKGAAVTLRVYNDLQGPFWHSFFIIFVNDLKSIKVFVFNFLMVLDYKKHIILRSSFHYFYMFFQNQSWGPFLEGPSAELL